MYWCWGLCFVFSSLERTIDLQYVKLCSNVSYNMVIFIVYNYKGYFSISFSLGVSGSSQTTILHFKIISVITILLIEKWRYVACLFSKYLRYFNINIMMYICGRNKCTIIYNLRVVTLSDFDFLSMCLAVLKLISLIHTPQLAMLSEINNEEW